MELTGAGSVAPRPADDRDAVTWGGRHVLFGGLLILLILLFVNLLVWPIIDRYGEDSDQAQRALYVADLAGRIIVVLAIFYMAGGGDVAWRRLGLRWPAGLTLSRAASLIGIGFLSAWIALASYGFIVDALGIDSLEPTGQIEDRVFEDTVLVILLGISVVVSAPISEELFFRGFMFAGVRRSWGVLPALLISIALFGLAHTQTGDDGVELGLIIPTGLIAAILAVSYQRSQTLYVPFGIHLVFNLVSFVVLVLYPEGRG